MSRARRRWSRPGTARARLVPWWWTPDSDLVRVPRTPTRAVTPPEVVTHAHHPMPTAGWNASTGTSACAFSRSRTSAGWPSSRQDTPAIFPINYALDGEAVVFRTAPGTKLTHGPRAPATFEIDGLDRAARTGWSVVATGRLEEVTTFDAPTLERVRALAIRPWTEGDKGHWMRLVPDIITGRRVGPGRGAIPTTDRRRPRLTRPRLAT